MYTPEHMTKWKMESDYGGEDMSAYYILVARTRDSYNLDNSNYESILRDIKAEFSDLENEDSGWTATNFGHWACGWIESIMIHESCESVLIWADKIKGELDNYPVYDEEDLSERELELIHHDIKEYWLMDYLNDSYPDLELTESQLDSIAYDLNREFEPEVNGYDEVITSTPDAEIHAKIDSLIVDFQNQKTCPICKAIYDNVKSACDCQMRLEL